MTRSDASGARPVVDGLVQGETGSWRERFMSKQHWYHWLALALITVLAAIIGLIDLTMGASTDSPNFVADDIFVRVIGLAFVISSILMILRRRQQDD